MFQNKARFIGYACIGCVVLCVDIFTLRALLLLKAPREGAVALAFLAAMAVQFTLNRWLNFRSSNGTLYVQVLWYLIITGANITLSIVLIDALVLSIGVDTLIAKVITLPITVPLGYLGHSYFTFGKGSQAALKYLNFKLTPHD